MPSTKAPSLTVCAVAGLVALAGAATANADVIFDTGAPDPGFFGFIGFDLSPDQSVAVAFTPTEDVIVNSIGVWMMNNNFDGVTFPSFTMSLVENADDGGLGAPSGNVLEQWDMQTSAVGFDPRLETARSIGGTFLEAGEQYWIVGTSTAPPFENPVWVWGTGEAVNAVDNALAPGWNVLPGGATPSVFVDATVVPAPASAALLGVAGLGATRRRRRA